MMPEAEPPSHAVPPPMVVDLSGLACPLPVLRASRILRDLPTGQSLTLITTDPKSYADIPVFCRQAGHRCLDMRRDSQGRFCLLVECGTGNQSDSVKHRADDQQKPKSGL